MCYLNGYRDSQGNALLIKRDAKRNLMSLTAPGGRWLHFLHPADARDAIRITRIVDNNGRQVLYGYNAEDQLTTVTYPSGEVYTYEYDDRQDLLTVSVSQHKGVPLTLVTNQYEKGQLVQQTFADGRVYRYGFTASADQEGNGSAKVTDPDGNVFNVDFSNDGTVVHQHPPSAPARHKLPLKVAANIVAVSGTTSQ